MIRSSCIIETYDKHARVQCACAYGSSNVSMTSCSAIRNLRGLLLWSTTQTYKKKNDARTHAQRANFENKQKRARPIRRCETLCGKEENRKIGELSTWAHRTKIEMITRISLFNCVASSSLISVYCIHFCGNIFDCKMHRNEMCDRIWLMHTQNIVLNDNEWKNWNGAAGRGVRVQHRIILAQCATLDLSCRTYYALCVELMTFSSYW